MSSNNEMKNIHGEKKVIEEKTQLINSVVVTPNFQRLNDAKYLSSQKKDIFYNAFRNIRERYQYKDQRIQNIRSRFEKISNELKLPLIQVRNYLQISKK